MRVTVTAVSPAMRRRADVLIDADPETPVSEIAARLNRLLDGGIPQASGPLAGHATLAGGHPAALSAPVLRPAGRAPVPGLFAAGQRLVVIYSSNTVIGGSAPHVRHRRFTPWVEAACPQWRLSQVTPGPSTERARADFFLYERS